jgi:HK97 family phage major capsid protein
MTEKKSGARHSAKDQSAIQQIHDHAIELGAEPAATKAVAYNELVDRVSQAVYRIMRPDTPDGYGAYMYVELVYDGYAIVRADDGTEYRATYTVTPDGVTVQPRAEWQRVEKEWQAKMVAPVYALKALGDGKIGGYLVRFSTADDPDLTNDYFDAATDYDIEDGAKTAIYYNHGIDATLKRRKLGTGTLSIQDAGVWLEAQLAMRDEYEKAVYSLVEKGKAGLSSGTAPHLVEREQAGKSQHITRWPLGLDASITPTPAEPRTSVVALKSLIPDPPTGTPAPGIGAGDAQPGDADVRRLDLLATLDTLEQPMEPKTIAEFVKAARDAIVAGNMDLAEKYTKSAQALKALDALDTPEKGTAVRLPFGDPASQTASDEPSAAVKNWSIKRYGEIDAGMAQVARELYGASYEQAAYEKHVDFNRYLRTGESGSRKVARQLLLTPEQLLTAMMVGVDETKATLIESSDTLGGYTVPEDFRLQLIQRLPGLVSIRQRATVITTMSDRVTFPTVTGGDDKYRSAVRVTWVDESPTAGSASSNPLFGQLNIPVFTVMGDTTLSRNLIEDQGVDLTGWLATEFANAFAQDEESNFLTGSGAGRPQGVLNGTAALGAPFNADVVTVNTGSGTTVTGDGIKAVPTNLAAQYRNAPGVAWVGARATYLAIKQLKDSQQNYLWSNRDFQMTGGTEPTLEGYPIIESEWMPSLGANKYPIIFGDWSGYIIADRIGMSIERYLDSATARTNSVIYVARRRLGGQIKEGWKFAVSKVST